MIGKGGVGGGGEWFWPKARLCVGKNDFERNKGEPFKKPNKTEFLRVSQDISKFFENSKKWSFWNLEK